MSAIRRFLRSPRVIVSEVAFLAASAAVMTAIPQQGDPKSAARFAAEYPGWASPVHLLWLDRILTSPWLLAGVIMAGASLSIVLAEQWRRCFRQWRTPLTMSSFSGAPYQNTFFRSASNMPAGGDPITMLESRGRLGMLGSPLFHTGLALVLLGGLMRLLFAADAVVELMEGETLPAEASAYGAQWGGLLAPAFTLDAPLAIEKISPAYYPSGELKSLEAQASYGGRPVQLGINSPMRKGNKRIYLMSSCGPGVVFKFGPEGGGEEQALFLHGTAEEGVYYGVATLGGGLEIRMRAAGNPKEGGSLPDAIQVRIMNGGALLAYGDLPVGKGMRLLSNLRLDLLQVRRWAEFKGSRDASTWPAYAGFLFALAGAILMFAVVRIDSVVDVRRTDEGERVFVALCPHRFAPLFKERFEALARREGAPPESLG